MFANNNENVLVVKKTPLKSIINSNSNSNSNSNYNQVAVEELRLALQDEKSKVSELQSKLINSDNDVNEYKRELARLQEEGKNLYVTYVSKCQKIKEFGGLLKEVSEENDCLKKTIEVLNKNNNLVNKKESSVMTSPISVSLPQQNSYSNRSLHVECKKKIEDLETQMFLEVEKQSDLYELLETLAFQIQRGRDKISRLNEEHGNEINQLKNEKQELIIDFVAQLQTKETEISLLKEKNNTANQISKEIKEQEQSYLQKISQFEAKSNERQAKIETLTSENIKLSSQMKELSKKFEEELSFLKEKSSKDQAISENAIATMEELEMKLNEKDVEIDELKNSLDSIDMEKELLVSQLKQVSDQMEKEKEEHLKEEASLQEEIESLVLKEKSLVRENEIIALELNAAKDRLSATSEVETHFKGKLANRDKEDKQLRDNFESLDKQRQAISNQLETKTKELENCEKVLQKMTDLMENMGNEMNEMKLKNEEMKQAIEEQDQIIEEQNQTIEEIETENESLVIEIEKFEDDEIQLKHRLETIEIEKKQLMIQLQSLLTVMELQ